MNKLWWTGVPDATYQVSWKSACRFWRRRSLKGFYHIWAWGPSWSCDPDAANKLWFPLPKEAPHKIWLWSGKRFWRRRSLSIVNGRWRTDGRTADHGCPISSPMSLWLRWAKKLEAVKEFCHLGEMLSAESNCELTVPTLQVCLGASLAISTTSHQPSSAILVLTLSDLYSEHYSEPRHEKTALCIFLSFGNKSWVVPFLCHWNNEQTCIISGKINPIDENAQYSDHNLAYFLPQNTFTTSLDSYKSVFSSTTYIYRVLTLFEPPFRISKHSGIRFTCLSENIPPPLILGIQLKRKPIKVQF